MTYLHDDPDTFVDEFVTGFAYAHGDLVRRVAGGVLAVDAPRQDRVAVVIGGGSGHYPAFAGLVGPGLASGAALGGVFASPSANQVFDVASAAHGGRGVLLTFGNYAGDVLNFRAAAQRLSAAGVDNAIVTVTDDVASAPVSAAHERRGIAGDLYVFKVAGAAAQCGLALDDVAAMARRANAHSASMGVAFSGCRLPGSSEPLFTVPDGAMAVGMGIHGEPGLETTDRVGSRELAQMLLDRLLEDLDARGVLSTGDRVVPIVNGLGSVKHEELFIMYRAVHEHLLGRGLVPVSAQVGEFCTSFEMAGVSVSLLVLDEDLAEMWSAAASTPAFTTGTLTQERVHPSLPVEVAPPVVSSPQTARVEPADRERARTGAQLFDVIEETLVELRDELGRLDAVAGDGDHGMGMARGARGAARAARETADAGGGLEDVLRHAGQAWSDHGGGTSGALWGAGLVAVADGVAAGIDPATVTGVATLVDRACAMVQEMGGARPGDKTLVDALVPFSESLNAAAATGLPWTQAWIEAVDAAAAGVASTERIPARLGRARTHGKGSLGTPDPGCVSLLAVITAVGRELGLESRAERRVGHE